MTTTPGSEQHERPSWIGESPVPDDGYAVYFDVDDPEIQDWLDRGHRVSRETERAEAARRRWLHDRVRREPERRKAWCWLIFVGFCGGMMMANSAMMPNAAFVAMGQVILTVALVLAILRGLGWMLSRGARRQLDRAVIQAGGQPGTDVVRRISAGRHELRMGTKPQQLAARLSVAHKAILASETGHRQDAAVRVSGTVGDVRAHLVAVDRYWRTAAPGHGSGGWKATDRLEAPAPEELETWNQLLVTAEDDLEGLEAYAAALNEVDCRLRQAEIRERRRAALAPLAQLPSGGGVGLRKEAAALEAGSSAVSLYFSSDLQEPEEE